MDIEYFGHSCFRITTNGGTTVLTDPYTKVGYELPANLSSEIVTVSHGHFDHNYLGFVKNNAVIINTTQTFSYKDVKITGTETYHDPFCGKLRGKNIVYTIQADGITVCHLGDLGEACSENVLAKIGKVDVLFIPIGGTYTIDAQQAKEYIFALKPKIVIPMHYRPKDGTLDIDGAEMFLQLLQDKVVYINPKNRLSGVEKHITEGETKIVFMEKEP